MIKQIFDAAIFDPAVFQTVNAGDYIVARRLRSSGSRDYVDQTGYSKLRYR